MPSHMLLWVATVLCTSAALTDAEAASETKTRLTPRKSRATPYASPPGYTWHRSTTLRGNVDAMWTDASSELKFASGVDEPEMLIGSASSAALEHATAQ